MSLVVEIATVEPRAIAAVRRTCPQSELARVIPEACGDAWNRLKARGVKGGRLVALYFDDVMNLAIGAEVDPGFTGDGELVAETLPGGTVARATHVGPYHLLGATHSAVHAWCRANGHRLAGPSWEIYGHWSDDPAKLTTEVVYLLAV